MDLGGTRAGACAACVQILQRVDLKGVIDQRTNPTGGGQSGGKRRNARDFVPHGGTTNGLFIVERFAAERRIDNEIDAARLYEIDDIGAPFVGLVHSFGAYAGAGQGR